MTKANKRTTPLDRDGDGHDGGSLPGNQTAPMADEAAPAEGEPDPDLSPEEAASDPATDEAAPDEPMVDAGTHDTEIAEGTDGDAAATFTAEEIAAGETPLAQEDEAEITAADAATVIPEDDALVTIQTETAPVAVRQRELQILVDARRLYKSPEGYSATYGAPYIETATVEAWIKAGLAEDVPSGGNTGAVKVTHEARRALTELKHGVAE